MADSSEQAGWTQQQRDEYNEKYLAKDMTLEQLRETGPSESILSREEYAQAIRNYFDETLNPGWRSAKDFTGIGNKTAVKNYTTWTPFFLHRRDKRLFTTWYNGVPDPIDFASALLVGFGAPNNEKAINKVKILSTKHTIEGTQAELVEWERHQAALTDYIRFLGYMHRDVKDLEWRKEALELINTLIENQETAILRRNDKIDQRRFYERAAIAEAARRSARGRLRF